ncbi:tRNA uridine-5-carboxymethylaminomethyl(34) synthesis GTPase MnmE [Nibricoccus sp. IMCC34717]|uniref:tRNA uridine-5-carboxymethylaminomethyl(34) synthesis GTPase MnmE n=1 Tax=Nibricoccus sp. IMCC34717 TaxID=3034021 RepID=UPI00384AF2E7
MRPPPDTIAALATPVGTSALAVVRVSGPAVPALCLAALGRELAVRVATLCDYRALDGRTLDSLVATAWRAPASFTGEDCLELSCHGNPLIAQNLLADLLRRGCRAAEPGEFTRRAFENGKLDLTQAEAVVDLIHARGERALEAARKQLDGGLRDLLNPLVDKLLSLIARVEAYIDFPDEDLPGEDRAVVLGGLETLAKELDRLLATRRYGELLRDGIRTVIIGAPNAGKSSLLNCLVGRERALVSPEPGTTRDFIEETVLIGGHCVRLVDTAGLNPSPAPLEALGMRKTRERAADADLLLWVVDCTVPLPALPPEVAERFTSSEVLVVANKADLPHPVLALPESAQTITQERIIFVSALTGEGFPALLKTIGEMADRFQTELGAEQIAINARHADALERAQATLTSAQTHLRTNGPSELLASDLRSVLDALGEIGGKVDNERMLDHLFATFCIGK